VTSAEEHARKEALLIAAVGLLAPLAPGEITEALPVVQAALRDSDATLDPI